MLNKLTELVRQYFVRSNAVHLHQNPAQTVEEIIALIDRFLDGTMRYDMEWDDFISWKNDNGHLEQIRNRIGEFEPLLFSIQRKDRDIYLQKLVEERNRLAALLNIPVREF